LSGGGFCFISRNPIEAGKELILNFKLTNGKTFNHIKGLVKWNKEKVTGQYEHGIEFLDLDNRQREELISYLFELQRNRRIID
jgi:c-di-GMP-binding flagellar brake protein YcgR